MPTLAVLTSGGDAPGMNAAVHALTRAGQVRGWRVLGVLEGFVGLKEGRLLELDEAETISWARLGGTKLGTSRLADLPRHVEALQASLHAHGVTHLAVLGGNGSLAGAALLQGAVRVVGLPATIDNDVAASDESIGFDTALNTGLTLLDGLRDTAEAMPRLFALETLGGSTGFLAQAVGEAGGADLVLVPERPLEEVRVLGAVEEAMRRRRYALLVASEGYPDVAGLVERVSAAVGTRSRFSRIGHAQRGGRPSARDRLLGLELALVATEALSEGRSGVVVWSEGRGTFLPFDGESTSKLFTHREWL